MIPSRLLPPARGAWDADRPGGLSTVRGRGPARELFDTLLLWNPRVALDAASVGKVDEYLQRGGNLLWMLEAGEKNGLDRLAHALSIRVLDGIVVDGAGQALGIEDPSMVALSAYPDHAILFANVIGQFC